MILISILECSFWATILVCPKAFSPSFFSFHANRYFNEKIAFDSKSANRRLDAGVNFGLGYRKGPLQVQIGYGLGLRNLHQQPPAINYVIYDYLDAHHDFSADAAYVLQQLQCLETLPSCRSLYQRDVAALTA